MARRAFHRTDRLNRQVKEALAVALRQGAREERLRDIIVTDVEVTRDLSVARVFYYLADPSGQADVERALARAAGFLRGRVAESIRARQVPELRFRYDRSVETGRRVEEILAGLQPAAPAEADAEPKAEAQREAQDSVPQGPDEPA